MNLVVARGSPLGEPRFGNGFRRSTSRGPLRPSEPRALAQAKQAYENIRAATGEASNTIRNAYSTAAQGAVDYNVKLIEVARANTNAAFDYAHELLGVKSPSEFFEVSTGHARRQFEVLSEQSKELTTLAQKVMIETTAPLKAGLTNAYREQ